jgi:hypothetical protein
MNSKIVGTVSKKNIKNISWWIKLGLALILSNIFFFALFSKNETSQDSLAIPSGWVELQIRAELLTPFQTRKKVLLINRPERKRIEGILETNAVEPEGRFTVLVKESEAVALLKFGHWEIVPFLKTFEFPHVKQGVSHEIRY